MWTRIRDISQATLAQAATPIAAFLVGLIAFAVAVTALLMTSGQSLTATIAFWIAQTTIGGGIVVAVMRALQSADYFEAGVRRVLYDHNLPVGPLNFPQAWRNLTISLMRQRFTTLQVDASDLQHAALMGDTEYFYIEHTRIVEIDWKDRAKGIIVVKDCVNAKIRTADVGHTVTFTNWFKPEADTSRRLGISCTFTGAVTKTLSDTDIVECDGRQTLSIDLPPASEVVMVREFTKEQDLYYDPILNYTSLGIMNRPSVHISCPPGLRFYFRKTGTSSNFVAKGGNVDLDAPLKKLVAQYDGLCFRNQGYIINIVQERTDQS
jgi:hypothetical protein